jgi:hypothetical protein
MSNPGRQAGHINGARSSLLYGAFVTKLVPNSDTLVYPVARISIMLGIDVALIHASLNFT